jgi:TPR repeat protein
MSEQPGSAPPPVIPVPRHSPAAAAAPTRPLDGRPFDERRRDLERRAMAGDGRAAGELGSILAKCNRFTAAPDDQIQQWVVDAVAVGMSVRDEGSDLAPEEILSRARLAQKQGARDCSGVSGLNQDDAREEALRWIEKGAALGDADAKAMYGELAFSQLKLRTALADAEDIRERKQRAIGYLQSSLAQGDALALLSLSSHYATGDLVPANAETSYAYLYAYSLTSRAADLVPEVLEWMLARGAAQLDGQSLQRARDEGARLAQCCSGTAGTP